MAAARSTDSAKRRTRSTEKKLGVRGAGAIDPIGLLGLLSPKGFLLQIASSSRRGRVGEAYVSAFGEDEGAEREEKKRTTRGYGQFGFSVGEDKF